jgi:FkbM family methyltransferase
MRLEKYEGIYVRKGVGPDVGVIKEYKPTYRRMIQAVEGHRFLDIGANIGMFTVRAMENGATGGVCYEPEAGAIEVLKKNIEPWKRKISIFKCAIEKDAGVVDFHVPKSGNAVTASTFFKPRGRNVIQVRAKGFLEAVEESKASLIKFDCEGAELTWLTSKLPAHVKVVCGELHREHGNEAKCAKLIKEFRGWEAIHAPISYSYARCWIVAWRRK